MELCVSIIDVSNEVSVDHVICNRKSQLNMLDFENNIYFYSINNKGIFYDILRKKTREYRPVVPLKSLSQHFKNTLYMSEDGRWFFDQIGEKIEASSFIFELVDKENDVVISKFLSKSRNFQDFNNKIRDGKILTYNSRNGLEIIDIKGISLYSLSDDSLRTINRAVLHEDKVYAAGITTRDSPLGKKEYIEIIQWDYKNDSVIKKYYPCDSPELEM